MHAPEKEKGKEKGRRREKKCRAENNNNAQSAACSNAMRTAGWEMRKTGDGGRKVFRPNCSYPNSIRSAEESRGRDPIIHHALFPFCRNFFPLGPAIESRSVSVLAPNSLNTIITNRLCLYRAAAYNFSAKRAETLMFLPRPQIYHQIIINLRSCARCCEFSQDRPWECEICILFSNYTLSRLTHE